MKGILHTMEAIIAGIIVILFLVAIVSRQASVAPGPSVIIMQGLEELRDLDRKGILRDYVIDRDNTGLNSEVRIGYFNHSISICDTGGACTGSAPSAENVWLATYFVAGKNDYTPYEVILYLW